MLGRSSRVRLSAALLVSLSMFSCKSEQKLAPAPAASGAASAKAIKPSTNLPDLDAILKLDDAGASPLAAASGAASGAPADPNAPTAAGSAEAPPGPGSPITVKLVEAGAEPRASARYEFAIDKSQTATATIKMSPEMGGAPGSTPPPQPPIRLTLKVTPKAKNPDGNVKFALEVSKAEIMTGGMAVPPEAVKEIKTAEASLATLAGSFVASPRGALSEVKFGAGKNVPPEAQELVLPLVELLFAPLPEEPIGIGARWTLTAGDPMEGTMKSSFTMTSRSPTGADITVESSRKTAARPIPDPRAPAGATMALDGKGKTAMTVRFGGIAAKVDGSSSTSITLKDPSTTPPRSTTNSLKVQHTLESK